MAKQALGRNLGALLEGNKTSAPASQTTATQPAPVSSGVRSLMRGSQSAAITATPNPAPAIPGWYLLGGDILLTAIAVVVAYKSPHPLSLGREIFCTAAVLLGGLLAMIALWVRPE